MPNFVKSCVSIRVFFNVSIQTDVTFIFLINHYLGWISLRKSDFYTFDLKFWRIVSYCRLCDIAQQDSTSYKNSTVKQRFRRKMKQTSAWAEMLENTLIWWISHYRASWLMKFFQSSHIWICNFIKIKKWIFENYSKFDCENF